VYAARSANPKKPVIVSAANGSLRRPTAQSKDLQCPLVSRRVEEEPLPSLTRIVARTKATSISHNIRTPAGRILGFTVTRSCSRNAVRAVCNRSCGRFTAHRGTRGYWRSDSAVGRLRLPLAALRMTGGRRIRASRGASRKIHTALASRRISFRTQSFSTSRLRARAMHCDRIVTMFQPRDEHGASS